METKVTFSGASDDLLHTTPEDETLVELNGTDLDEFSYLPNRGWLVEQPDGDSWTVNAEYDGLWRFSIGFDKSLPGASEDGHAMPLIETVVTRSDSCSYSTQLTATIPVGSRISALPK